MAFPGADASPRTKQRFLNGVHHIFVVRTPSGAPPGPMDFQGPPAGPTSKACPRPQVWPWGSSLGPDRSWQPGHPCRCLPLGWVRRRRHRRHLCRQMPSRHRPRRHRLRHRQFWLIQLTWLASSQHQLDSTPIGVGLCVETSAQHQPPCLI